MTTRHVIAVAAALVSAAAAPGHAATKLSCQLLVDGSGDATVVPMGPSSNSVDIRSADIATGKRNVVGVLRLASLAADPQTSGGSVYSLSWSVGGKPHKFDLTLYADGSTAAGFSVDSTTGSGRPVAVTVDRSTSSIIWTASRKSDPSLKSAGSKLIGLAATAQPSVSSDSGPVTTSIAYNGDSADHGKTYLDSSPSCVKGT